ncbi:transmembrane protein 221-like [Haliotis cracherodii]|uniref:transmembrane protein 221-like n=1 Tax=Haliotis cracherodii TaxID=6455 RepID=UPI0039E988E1
MFPQMMQDYNRAAENCRDRELLDVILQKQDEHRSDAGSRISTLLARTNGNLSRPSSFSRRSLNLSRQSLASASRVTLCEKESSVIKFLYSLGLLCLASLILCVLSLQIIFSLGGAEVDFTPGTGATLINSTSVYESVLEVTVAMSMFVIMMDICCLMVCSMQCFFASKILKTPEGEERALKYLRECSSSRFIAVIGFFLSIPSFLLALMLFAIMKLKTTPALTSSVILGAGILFCILSVMQNSYHWRAEKSRADEGLPVYETSPHSHKTAGEVNVPRNELSTLV